MREINKKANASVFVIPNKGCRSKNLLCNKDAVELDMEEVCKANGTVFNPEADWLIELWWVSREDLSSDNLRDHGLSFRSEDGTMIKSGPGCIPFWLPAKLIDGKEGDHKTVIFPEVNGFTGEREPVKIRLELNVELNQSDFRYRGWGLFEEVFSKVRP